MRDVAWKMADIGGFRRLNLSSLHRLNDGGLIPKSYEEPKRDHLMRQFIRILRDNRGATAIEYGLIAALIAVAAITAMTALGNQLSTTFNNVSNNMKAS